MTLRTLVGWPLGLLAAAVLAGCPQAPISGVPNSPPILRIEEPVVGPSGDPILADEGEGVVFVAVVSDSEEDPDALVIHWTAERTDTVLPVVDLGDTQPDSAGWSEKLVSGLEPGLWGITAEVEDSEQATDSATVPLEILSDNTCPAVTITQPEPGDIYIQGELVTFTGTVNDDRGLEGVSIEWFSDIDGLLDVTPPAETGLLTFSRSNLSPGEHTVSLTAIDEDEAACSVEVVFEVVEQNLPPYDFEVAIFPESPFSSDELQCLITVGSADPEGQPITYSTTWYVDGVPTLLDDSIVPADQTSNLQEWTCEVIASDGTLTSNPASDTVLIANTLPTADYAMLGPEPAYEYSILLCEGFGYEDLDGDPEGWEATWYVDGTPVPGVTDITLDGTWFDRDQEVYCDLAPFDGYSAGTPVTSNTILVVNSAPSPPTLSVTPGPSATVDSDLVCNIDVDAVDPDGDPITNPDSYEVLWSVDGVPYPDADGLWTIGASSTGLGDVWICEVRATDGFEWGPWASAGTEVLPDAGDLVISELLAAPSTVPDVAGEWVEVYNASGTTMSLLGFELHDDSGDSHVIGDDIVLPAGTRVVLARNGDYLSNGNVLAAYEYSNFVLDDAEDEIVLSFDGIEIDRVEYDLLLYPAGTPGHSLSWDPAAGVPEPTLNDDPANWCHSGNPIALPGASDFGTPGGANDSCACFLSDSDGDGWGDDASCSSIDCDDVDPGFSPGEPEICEDGIDQNCDGLDAICPCLDTDDDGDGYGDGLGCSDVDCDDGDSTIYPGAPELCDTVDQDCDGTPDNGDPSAMCPPSFQVSSTLCDGSGDCQVASCNGGFYDVNSQYGDGCECGDEGYGASCGTAFDLGDVNVGGAISPSGILPTSSNEDWLRVSFPAGSGRPGGGTPTISFAARPTTDYFFEVFYNCSGAPAVCGTGVSFGATDYSFVDNQSVGYNTNASLWPEDVYIRVYRTGGSPSCTSYQLSITR